MFSSIFNVKFNGFVVPGSVFETYSCITYYEIFKLSKLLLLLLLYIYIYMYILGGGQNDIMFVTPVYSLGGGGPL